MNVLSLFDGMSCGRIALERAGVTVTNYFASEIDKYAIQVSKANWPDIKHVGSVTSLEIIFDNGYTTILNYISGETFTFEGKIDLIVGGSPCQGFSFAGKQLNFKDARSALFFEYVRLKEESQATYFFLENVVMKQEYQDVISGFMGVQPIKLNAALVSAQNRKRLYWTNIPYFGAPADRGILLKHILVKDFANDIELKSLCLSAGYSNNPSLRDYNKSQKQLIRLGNSHPSSSGMNGEVYSIEGKAPTVTTNKGEGSKIGMLQVGLADDIKGFDANRRIYSPEGKGPTLISSTGGHKAPKVELIPEDLYLSEEEVLRGQHQASAKVWHTGNKIGKMDFPNNPDKKAKTLTVVQTKGGRETNHFHNGVTYRKLTVTECERLQNVGDGYVQRLAPAAKQISNTQAYKMLGNGWECNTITYLFTPLSIIDLL